MHYEINVSKRTGKKNWNGTDEYHHYFATAERSLNNPDSAKKMWEDFKVLFPAPEYELSITKWEKIGKPVDFTNE